MPVRGSNTFKTLETWLKTLIFVLTSEVFLCRFGAFLRLEVKFSKLLVQPPYHKSNIMLLHKVKMLFYIHANDYVLLYLNNSSKPTFIERLFYSKSGICLVFIPLLSVLLFFDYTLFYSVLAYAQCFFYLWYYCFFLEDVYYFILSCKELCNCVLKKKCYKITFYYYDNCLLFLTLPIA